MILYNGDTILCKSNIAYKESDVILGMRYDLVYIETLGFFGKRYWVKRETALDILRTKSWSRFTGKKIEILNAELQGEEIVSCDRENDFFKNEELLTDDETVGVELNKLIKDYIAFNFSLDYELNGYNYCMHIRGYIDDKDAVIYDRLINANVIAAKHKEHEMILMSGINMNIDSENMNGIFLIRVNSTEKVSNIRTKVNIDLLRMRDTEEVTPYDSAVQLHSLVSDMQVNFDMLVRNIDGKEVDITRNSTSYKTMEV